MMAAKKKAAKQAKSVPCGAVNNKPGCRQINKPCPKTLQQMCDEMRAYMRCMCEWGFDVSQRLEVLENRVSACCGGPGPNPVPKPPPPPF